MVCWQTCSRYMLLHMCMRMRMRIRPATVGKVSCSCHCGWKHACLVGGTGIAFCAIDVMDVLSIVVDVSFKSYRVCSQSQRQR